MDNVAITIESLQFNVQNAALGNEIAISLESSKIALAEWVNTMIRRISRGQHSRRRQMEHQSAIAENNRTRPLTKLKELAKTPKKLVDVILDHKNWYWNMMTPADEFN